ncbi:tetratricopeptide repeat protein [Pyxidicoccus xibeiensis]|uniref:tetratricopeptide repeat protein n=1 Tax=Pyxidicoccus xibeiensis TaxID=2906759 RepID=UPI0020A70029|nr:tetratricopeptide repeat protein [Pyxidicoccus xibeiensis]MCP3135809.1 hypothetical protein [Pyxidicoccus xibeiensis]
MTSFPTRIAGLALLVPALAWAQAPAQPPAPSEPPQPPSAAPTPSVAKPAELSPAGTEGIRLAQESCASDGFDKARCQKAISLLQEAERTDPDNTDVQLALAQAYWNTSYREAPQARSRGSLRERALGIYEKLVGRKTKDARPYWELSLRRKNSTERVPLLRRTVELNPKHPQANKDLAQAELKSGEVDAAVKSYEKHLEVSPYRDSQDAVDHLSFAKRLQQLGRSDAATRLTERVSRLMQGERRGTRCEIWRSVDTKLYESDGALAQRVRSLLPYCTKTEDLERASELAREGRVDEAISAAERQLQENPKPEETHVLLEKLYKSKGQLRRAADTVTRHLRQEPDAKEKCERFRALAPDTARAMPEEERRALERDCPQPE